MSIRVSKDYKNLPKDFKIPDQDFVVLCGPNNSGKSAILQYVASFSDVKDRADYISPSRFNASHAVSIDLESERRVVTLFMDRKNYRENSSEFTAPDPTQELFALDDELRDIALRWHNEYFGHAEVQQSNRRNSWSAPLLLINGRSPTQQGSGSRAVLAVLSRLVAPDVDYLLIDEPEISVEPQTQKQFFRLLKAVANGLEGLPQKKIYLATHSHLFLDREKLANNFIVTRDAEGKACIRPVTSEVELQNLVFQLLGNSPTDLFFPANIIVAEGPSDQLFFRRILELRGLPSIAVHFADGSGNISYALPAIDQMLKTTAYIPLYRHKICVLVEKQKDQRLLEKWKNYLGDRADERVIELDKSAIEFYYPPRVLAGISGIEEVDLDNALADFVNAIGEGARSANLGRFSGRKRELAQLVTDEMSLGDLQAIDAGIIRALELAAELSYPSVTEAPATPSARPSPPSRPAAPPPAPR